MAEAPQATGETSAKPPPRKGLFRVLLKIVGVLAVLIAVLLIVAVVQSDDFEVVRSTKISAPAAAVFPHVNDLHKWSAWSPWEKLDPNLKRTYDGEPAGVGAIYNWEGDANVGAGRMTIVESKPNEQLGIKLEFFRPFAGTNDVTWTFKPEGTQTTVTWGMKGKKAFMVKVLGLFISMDKMIGTNFEEGLATLKSVVEGSQGK